jgi:hypothetical protein
MKTNRQKPQQGKGEKGSEQAQMYLRLKYEPRQSVAKHVEPAVMFTYENPFRKDAEEAVERQPNLRRLSGSP